MANKVMSCISKRCGVSFWLRTDCWCGSGL